MSKSFVTDMVNLRKLSPVYDRHEISDLYILAHLKSKLKMYVEQLSKIMTIVRN